MTTETETLSPKMSYAALQKYFEDIPDEALNIDRIFIRAAKKSLMKNPKATVEEVLNAGLAAQATN